MPLHKILPNRVSFFCCYCFVLFSSFAFVYPPSQGTRIFHRGGVFPFSLNPVSMDKRNSSFTRNNFVVTGKQADVPWLFAAVFQSFLSHWRSVSCRMPRARKRLKYMQEQRSHWKCFLLLKIEPCCLHLEIAPWFLLHLDVCCLYSVSCGHVYFFQKLLERCLLPILIKTAESCSPVDNSDFVCIPLFFCFIWDSCLLKSHLFEHLFAYDKLFWKLGDSN